MRNADIVKILYEEVISSGETDRNQAVVSEVIYQRTEHRQGGGQENFGAQRSRQYFLTLLEANLIEAE